jgi:hypothetical protein
MSSKGKGKGKEDAWLILPSTEKAQSDGVGGEAKGRSIDRSVDGEESTWEREFPKEKKERPQEQKEQHKERKEARTHLMSIVWTGVAVLAGILLILAFAILIAHCLAWFIVYKTEARLGEAKRGLVQGGEMRLCLCARG